MEAAEQTEILKHKTKIYVLKAVKAYYYRTKLNDEKYKKRLEYMKEYMKKRYQKNKNKNI